MASIMAEFPSVIGATECAVEIQTVMAERNEGVPESRPHAVSQRAIGMY